MTLPGQDNHVVFLILTALSKKLYLCCDMPHIFSAFPVLSHICSHLKERAIKHCRSFLVENIASHIQCTKASEVVKDYEYLLMVDKFSWYTSHTIGTY